MNKKIQATEYIKDRERICAYLQVAAAFQSAVSLEENGSYSLLEAACIAEASLGSDGGYFCVKCDAPCNALPGSAVQFRVTGEHGLMELSTVCLSPPEGSQGTYRFRLPDMITIYYERRYLRVAPSESRPIGVIILDKYLLGLSPLIRLMDISQGGLAFEMYDAESIFRIGSRIEQMVISLPGEGECRVSGIVRFSCKNRCGIEFMGEDTGSIEAIERYLQQRQIIEKVQKKTYKAVSELECSMKIETGKKKILIADDSPALQKRFHALFSLHGFSVVQAFNGVEGVKQSIESMPDLILMDINMPLMNGIEAARLVRRHSKTCQIPICMFTSIRDKSAILQAASIGIADYIMKTDKEEDVLRRIKKILEKD
jgi:CheY-like chemotaxis protein